MHKVFFAMICFFCAGIANASQRQFIRYNNLPFDSSCRGAERENIDYKIGSSEVEERPCYGSNYPDQIKTLFEIIPIVDFDPSIEVSAEYRISRDLENNPDEKFVMNRKLYDGISLEVDGLVSGIEVKFINVDGPFPISERKFLKQKRPSYIKMFETQRNSIMIKPRLDKEFGGDGITDIMHFKSDAHFMGGVYRDDLSPHEIQPVLFYMGTGFQGKEYINSITTKKFLEVRNIELSQEVTKDKMNSLKDDALQGKIMLNIDGKFTYKSINIEKTAYNCGLCEITMDLEEEFNMTDQ